MQVETLPAPYMGQIKRFGVSGPTYEVGHILGQNEDGEILVEIWSDFTALVKK